MQSAADRTMELMKSFIGLWAGKGQGEFPTMDPFDYDETLEIEGAKGFPLLVFQQMGLVTTTGRPSHFEVGLIKVLTDGTIELGDIGNGMRAEIMKGTVTEKDEITTLDLVSTAFANDPRMIASRGVFVLKGDVLFYHMYMKTNTTDQPKEHLHLRTTLSRG
jgi:hypothetical protein